MKPAEEKALARDLADLPAELAALQALLSAAVVVEWLLYVDRRVPDDGPARDRVGAAVVAVREVTAAVPRALTALSSLVLTAAPTASDEPGTGGDPRRQWPELPFCADCSLPIWPGVPRMGTRHRRCYDAARRSA